LVRRGIAESIPARADSPFEQPERLPGFPQRGLTSPVCPDNLTELSYSDRPMPTADPDVIVCNSLKVVHNQGASLYNEGRHTEAFRIYQGALFVVLQLMTHRPDLRLIIGDGLSEIEESKAGDQLKAFRLHEVIDHVRKILRETSPAYVPGLSGKMEDPGKM
jgi:hypothetical protein